MRSAGSVFLVCFCASLGNFIVARGEEAGLLDPVQRAETRRVELIARIAPAVVCMLDSGRRGGGAGVIINEQGYGLTNYHVIARFMDTRRGQAGLPDGEVYPLRVLGVDVTGDVAMFKLSGRERFPAVPLGDSDSLSLGDPVLAMGNPFALAWDYTPSVSFGIVSGLHRYQHGSGDKLIYTDCIQTDAAINPGNSGGPLFNLAGEVVGINGRASFEERGRVSVGLGYAITSNQIRRFIPALRAGRLAYHGTLDATVIDDAQGRVVFDRIDDDSVAARVGIRVGDELIQFAGHTIRSANHFASLLGTFPENWPVQVAYRRSGQEHTARVRLGRLPVTLDTPIPDDAEQNLAETLRVLKRYAEAVGGRNVTKALLEVRWEASRRQQGKAQQVKRKQAVHLDPLTVPADEPVNLWAWNLVELPGPEEQARWAFIGADEHDGELVEVIERLGDGGKRVRFAFSPTTHRLRRVQVVSPAGRVEREYTYHDYRQVNAILLPFWMAQGGADLAQRAVEIVDRYELHWDS